MLPYPGNVSIDALREHTLPLTCTIGNATKLKVVSGAVIEGGFLGLEVEEID